MDQNSLPPLPSVEELFAPSTSQPSSLPFLKNVNLFIPVPPLPPLSSADMPPMPPESPSLEYTEPFSPVPPQPTSPLVDRFDYQLGDNKTGNSAFQPEQNRSSKVISSEESLSGCPPSKKARYSETAKAGSLLQHDSREEGEISDESDDVDRTVMAGKSRRMPASPHLSVSHDEYRLPSSSHRQVPTNCSPNVLKEPPTSSHHRQSHTSDTGRSYHHRHRVHASHRSSKELTGHQQTVDGASAHRTERSSSSHKKSVAHSDGHKELDSSRDAARISSRHHLSNDRAAGTESAKHELRPERKSSGHAHRRLSSNGTAATETAKGESQSAHHRHHSLPQSDLPLSSGFTNDSSRTSDRKSSLTSELETTEKDGSEITSQHRPPSLDGRVHKRDLSGSISRSSRLQHVPAGSTLGSEIVKNLSRSSAGQQTSHAKIALQLLSLQHQLTNSTAADLSAPHLNHQQRSVNDNSGKAGTAEDESQHSSNCRPSSQQSVSLKQTKNSQTSCHQPSVTNEFAAVKTTESLPRQLQPHVQERFGNSDRLQSLRIDTAHEPQPAAGTALTVTRHSSASSQTLCPQKDLDAPYSPGSLDLDDLFRPTVASPDLRGVVSSDNNASGNIDVVSEPRASTEPDGEITNTKVTDSDVEIDTADVVDVTAAAEDGEMAGESVAIEGRGQEYEIIDDLDSHADGVDDEVVASSDNSEVELDSGDDERSTNKHIKSQRSQRITETAAEACEQTGNNDDLEPCDDDIDGDDDFQAPLINNKIVLRGKSKRSASGVSDILLTLAVRHCMTCYSVVYMLNRVLVIGR